MCFFYALYKEKNFLEKRFNAIFKNITYSPFHFANGFSRPLLPIIANNKQSEFSLFKWGIIPSWVKNMEKDEKISISTLNARQETIFEKPSFKKPIYSKRALIPANGFFEWHHDGNLKTPYFIRLKSENTFAFAGIWDSWKNPHDNILINTFSIITKEADPFTTKIHNSKKRVPVILTLDEEELWLDKLNDNDIKKILSKKREFNFEAHIVESLPRNESMVFNENIIKPVEMLL